MSMVTTEKNMAALIAANIERHRSATLSGKEAEALELLKHGLPTTKNEEFKHTPLTRELEKHFTFQGDAGTLPSVDLSAIKINGLEADTLVFVNGVYSKAHSSVSESRLVIKPLREALATDTIAKSHFSKYVNHVADAYVAWNTADWKDGIFIHVAANTVIERPVVFYHIHAGDAEATAVNRNLIVVENNSELTVIEKFASGGNGRHFCNLVNEVSVGENAGFNFYSLQHDEGQRYQYEHTQIWQMRSSRVNTFTFTLSGKVMRNNLQLALDGEGIESHMYGLYLLAGDTLADNHTVVDHKKPHSFSNEFYKGIMDDSSKGVFNGKIYVRPDAQKTNAFQANRNILMTDKAAVNTKPQLEIWADDVKCSHGCTSGQLDEEAVFYLQSRGISKETAKAMMLYAFAGEVLDHVKHPVIKDYLDQLISERLHKNF